MKDDVQKIKIGQATLYCGDAFHVLQMLDEKSFGGLLADPPYSSGGLYASDRQKPANVKYIGASTKYPNFAGDQKDQHSHFLWSYEWMVMVRSLLKSGSLAAVFSDWRQLPLTTDYFQSAGFDWRGIISWDKTEACRPILGRYRSQTEYAVWGTVGKRPLVGKTAPGAYRFPVGKKFHITSKPVELMKKLLEIMEPPILDPFMGAGAVGVACAEMGLPYVGIEINRNYFDIAKKRIEDATIDSSVNNNDSFLNVA